LSFTHYRELGPGPELPSIQAVPVFGPYDNTQMKKALLKNETAHDPEGAEEFVALIRATRQRILQSNSNATASLQR
jgi:hypothetical protein